MARQVLTIAGAVVGSAFGMPQLGFALGSMIGNAVDPVQIQGPKIGDLAVQTSRDGVPRPIVFGVAAVAGNIIDRSEPNIKKKKERQGKGGPETVTEHVYMSYAIRICEGPATSISRVWENEKLVYDVRPESTIAADSAKFAEKVTFYLGGESQLPDPTLEALHGVGNTPAHRGTCYAVWKDKDLTDFGGAIPQYRFEVNGLASAIDSSGDNVVFLLHFDGSNGSTVYTDETGKTWLGTADTYITTDQKKFGTGSLYGSGSGINETWIVCGDPYFVENTIGTQEFCLECFAWIGPSYAPTGNHAIMGFNTGAYDFGIWHNKAAGTNGRFSGSIVNGGNEIFGNTTYPNKEQWYHLALTRGGNTLRFFVDGILQGSVDVTGDSVPAASVFYIGDNDYADGYLPFLGRIDEARLTVGVPRYTSNFTPPTAQFPNP
jgi:hypothetical protein